MRVTILTYGSRGDFQPFLALAVGLQQAGHIPLLAGPARFAELAAQFQVPFASLAGDPAEISVRFNDAGSNPFKMVRSIRDYVYAIAPLVTRDARAALVGADFVIHSFLFTTGGHSFAREMGIPDLSVQTFPMFAPTRDFPNVALSWLPVGSLSYFSHWLATQIFWYGGNSGQRKFTRNQPDDFPSKLFWPFTETKDRPLTPLVIACSPTVLPCPAEWDAEKIQVPGYFFQNDTGYQPPVRLKHFLDAGNPPVCISFGSMLNRDAARVQKVMVEGLCEAGLRGILLTGWEDRVVMDEFPESILSMKDAPHEWLLRRCQAVVHHGGAGTTAAGLRAGIPNIVVPFAGDQPFWGRRVQALGAGPRPIPIKQLTKPALVAALRQAENAEIIKKAAQVGEHIRAENGVEAALRIVEQTADRFNSFQRSKHRSEEFL